MNQKLTIDFARNLDLEDPISKYREDFHIPKFNKGDAVYFNGNSLGLQLKKHDFYLKKALEDWAKIGVEGHFYAETPWIDYHKILTKNTALLVGANAKEVVTMNGLSVNLHLLLTSFYNPNKKRFKILCEPNLFPSDLYILQSQIKLQVIILMILLFFFQLIKNGVVSEDDIYNTILSHKDELSLIFIGGVNYYTGQVFDISKITKIGHLHDIVVGFDLAHAAGNIELKLHDWNVDFAAWCSYKYLNAGPGNVSSIFIHENQIKNKPFRLSAWWGHDATNRFSIQKNFTPIPSAEGWQLSNAPVLGMSIYRKSLECFHSVGMQHLIQKRIKMNQYLELAIKTFNKLSTTTQLKIITPGSADKRGAQLSIIINNNGKKIFNYLKKNGVYVDWREPNVMRLAPTPLYNSYEDIARFYNILCKCF